MSVSDALGRSARDFSAKYACHFDFVAFEARVEEFTFLRPIGGWTDVYKTSFEKLYRDTLEKVALGAIEDDLNAEAMLDDFEYMLIRPYANERNTEIKHRPYVGMDRVSRLAYLQLLTDRSPANSVDLYAEKYKNGEISLKQIRSGAAPGQGDRARDIEFAGRIQAIEAVNKSRSRIWRVFHPFKNNAEKRSSAQMKRTFIEQVRGGEAFYNETVAASYGIFEGRQRIQEALAHHMRHAREEMNRKQKMSEAIKESLGAEGLGREIVHELSPRIGYYRELAKEKQV